jgi:uncharacterized protein
MYSLGNGKDWQGIADRGATPAAGRLIDSRNSRTTSLCNFVHGPRHVSVTRCIAITSDHAKGSDRSHRYSLVPGATSPIVGASVITRGIVTGVKSNGFFIQEPDATVDADPATSEGIFVFTLVAPPGAAVVGAEVQVTGTVNEFVPGFDLLQPSYTQLTSPSVLQLQAGPLPLPIAVTLTPTFPDPAGPYDQLERLEGMRVSVTSLSVTGPTNGGRNETQATATSQGLFFGVITGVGRPFREAGIQAPDPPPSGGGSIPPIPRWDANPERLGVDSDGIVGESPIEVKSGDTVTAIVGPLESRRRRFRTSRSSR